MKDEKNSLKNLLNLNLFGQNINKEIREHCVMFNVDSNNDILMFHNKRKKQRHKLLAWLFGEHHKRAKSAAGSKMTSL